MRLTQSELEEVMAILGAEVGGHYYRLKRLDWYITRPVQEGAEEELLIAECRRYLRERSYKTIRERPGQVLQWELVYGQHLESGDTLLDCYTKAVLSTSPTGGEGEAV